MAATKKGATRSSSSSTGGRSSVESRKSVLGERSITSTGNTSKRVADDRKEKMVGSQADKAVKPYGEDESNAAASAPIADAVELVRAISAKASSSSLLNVQSAVHVNLLARSTKRKRLSIQRREGSESPSRRHDAQAGGSSSNSSNSNEAFSSGSGLMTDVDPLEPMWDTYKRWPQGLQEEEKAMADYFRRLKMIQLEQETRSIFIHDTNDDTQTIYTVSDVRALETEVRDLKVQLQARKQKAREIRAEVENLAGKMEVFDELQVDLKEAQELSHRIQDMKLELARLKAVCGISATIEGADEEGLTVPRPGSFTREEAEDILNRQLMAMEDLETDHAATLKAIEAAKRQVAAGTQAVEKLSAERLAAEKIAREAKAGAEKDRNYKMEAICRGYAATLKLFQGLMGIVSIDAPSSSCVRGVYLVSNEQARRLAEEVGIELYFDIVSNKLTGFSLESMSGRKLTDRLAPPASFTRTQLDRAVRANDASLLLQEALVCIEAAEPSE